MESTNAAERGGINQRVIREEVPRIFPEKPFTSSKKESGEALLLKPSSQISAAVTDNSYQCDTGSSAKLSLASAEMNSLQLSQAHRTKFNRSQK